LPLKTPSYARPPAVNRQPVKNSGPASSSVSFVQSEPESLNQMQF
jgi:hypothetical protein